MTNTDKFKSDVMRLAARKGDIQKTRAEIVQRFERAAPKLGELPRAVAAYWTATYADGTDKVAETNENAAQSALDKLCAMLDFLYDTNGDSGVSNENNALSDDDWRTLAELVNDEAERLPLDALSHLTARLVEKGAFK